MGGSGSTMFTIESTNICKVRQTLLHEYQVSLIVQSRFGKYY